MSSLALDRRQVGEAREWRLHAFDGARRVRGAPSELIEREGELDALAAAVRWLDSGRGTVIVLDAGAGLGKSALLEQARDLASSAGCAVRRAAPGPLERGFPFGVIRTLLEPPLRERSEDDRGELLDGPAQLAGALLLDGWAPDADATMLLAHSILWLCVRLAQEPPLALLVDDAQWSDPESLCVLSYVARRHDDLPLLLAVAARSDNAGAPTASLSELATLGSATLLHLRPLTPMGALRLIRRLAPETPTQVCCECHRAAAGSPWLIAELARQIAEHPAPEVTEYGRTIVRRRMAQLDPPSRAVAAALSVIGDDAPVPAPAAVAGVAIEELGAAYDALRSAGLLASDDDRFAHQLIAAAIRDDLAGTERERLHRGAARALIGCGASAEAVASHLLRCRSRRDPAAGDVLRRAAAAAIRRGAPETAAAYLERALEERAPGDERGRMLAQLATVAFDAGLPDSRRRLQEALSEVADHATRVDVLTRLAALGVVDGSGAFAGHEIEQLDAGTGDRDPQLATEAAALDMLLTMPERSAERARRVGAIRFASNADTMLRRVVVAHRAWLGGELGSPGAGVCAALALDALGGDLLLGAAGQRPAYHLCTRVLVMSDRTEDARVAIDALREHASASGSLRLRAAASWYASDLALRSGRVIDAEEHARSALATVEGDVNVFTAGAVAVLAAALAERGAFGEARDLLNASASERSAHARSWEPAVRHARARLSLHERDFERAYADAYEAGRRREEQGRPNPAWTPWRSTAALALAHLGRRSEAARLADAELALAERFGAPRAIARALHARAVAEPDDDARVALCERGMTVLARTPAVLESVRLRLELGRTLAYVGRRIEARDALRPALADADAVGATLLAQRARRELVATGLRPRRAAVNGVAALTPRQRQICEHAASGMSNLAIAHALFLSIKTVETHLAAGYRKLGVGGRRELAAKLAG
jgi:DNA-binding CsgD family transcriptional regulator